MVFAMRNAQMQIQPKLERFECEIRVWNVMIVRGLYLKNESSIIP
jgi:hypothetical protein